MDRRTFCCLIAGTSVWTTGCLVTNYSSRMREVGMTDALSFTPERLSVAPGTTVEWVNEGQIEHTVTARESTIPAEAEYFASGGFTSESAARTQLNAGLLGPDEVYRHTFEIPGTYDYYCIPHEGSGMTGQIQVRS